MNILNRVSFAQMISTGSAEVVSSGVSTTVSNFEKVALVAAIVFVVIGTLAVFVACLVVNRKPLPKLVPVSAPPLHTPYPGQAPIQSTGAIPSPHVVAGARTTLQNHAQPVAQSHQVDTSLTNLFNIEKKIEELRSTLKEKKEVLTTMMENVGEVAGLYEEQEEEIFALMNQLQEKLSQYPTILGKYLTDRFQGTRHRNQQEIYLHVAKLTGFMKTHSDENLFIKGALKEIDLFLSGTFFTSPTDVCLQEEKKVDLIVFHEFFTIIDEHFPYLEKEDPALAHRLKIKLANLPLVDGHLARTKFQNVYLSEVQQRQLMIDHFEQEENRAVDQAVTLIETGNLLTRDLKYLSKWIVTGQTAVSLSNQTKLHEALIRRLGAQALPSTNNSIQILNALKDACGLSLDNGKVNKEISELQKVSKVKNYFVKNQKVPRWYHTTVADSFEKIIESGQILVLKRQAYSGAWVSTQREPEIKGAASKTVNPDYVLIFNHDIVEVDPNVFIGWEKGVNHKRWRGLQKPLPLTKPTSTNEHYLVAVGLGTAPTQQYRKKIAALLEKKGFKNFVLFNSAQIDYMQQSIAKVIGNPNLSEKWWGKADVVNLDRVSG